MGKPFLNLTAVSSTGILRKRHQKWSLCLGAGINKGILPDWSDLTLNVINKTYKFGWDKTAFEAANKTVGFSFDSWIQACLNQHLANGNKIDSFTKIVENEIYSPLLKEADASGIKPALLNFLNKPHIKKNDLDKVLDFFTSRYANTTLMQLVDVLTEDPKKFLFPDAIISFNADTLLYSLLIAFNQRKHSTSKQPTPYEPYKLILKSYHNWGLKIPVMHLHGSIIPEKITPSKRRSKLQDGRDNLIFLESSYSKVASSMYTWAQTNFLYYALNTGIVFIGLSMSDPNIRKWLNWTTENINADLSTLHNSSIFTGRHLWVKPKPKGKDEQTFLETSVVHLGVKMGWLNDYGEIRSSLLNIMGK